MQSQENNTYQHLAQRLTKPPWMSPKKTAFPPTKKQQSKSKQNILPSVLTNLMVTTIAKTALRKASNPLLLLNHTLLLNRKFILEQHKMVSE